MSRKHKNHFKEWNATQEQLDNMDVEARTFYVEFMPLYKKYSGTKQLRKHIIQYLSTHEIKRKDDFRGQLICMWIEHIIEYRESNNIPFKAEDVYKIKVPQEILNRI